MTEEHDSNYCVGVYHNTNTNSPPVSVWSPDASLEDSDEQEEHMKKMDDELYIRRVFSFDEWEYNHPQYKTKSPLHREPISSKYDMNRYNDSLKSLIQHQHLPAEQQEQSPRTSPPSLFQEIWNKKLEEKKDCCGGAQELGYRNASFVTTASTSLETHSIPSPESAFRQFQNKHAVSPIDTTTAATTTMNEEAPWTPCIPRESSLSCDEGSFVHIDLDDQEDNSSGMMMIIPPSQRPQQSSRPHYASAWFGIPEFVLVPRNNNSSSSIIIMMEEEEEEVEL
ncbi:unnamed protein product [Cylindrotheca closterium]|uniref:Uncharacterized protein n=1 Tax=Cylindrotheca closterium TaxID=2856 RepID=A0AAD2CHE8_9STRA|nr:unnamed protein product [Cylindrotheca closterium]